jgi:hypothetical protein
MNVSSFPIVADDNLILIDTTTKNVISSDSKTSSQAILGPLLINVVVRFRHGCR